MELNEQVIKEKLEDLVFFLPKEEIEEDLYCTGKYYRGTLRLGNGETVGCCIDVNYYDGDGCIKFHFGQGMGSQTDFENKKQAIYDYFGVEKSYVKHLPPLLSFFAGEDYHRYPTFGIKTKHYVKIKVV